MPERESRTETLHAGAPLTVGGVTLLPIERVVVHAILDGHARAWFSATKEPYALVVHDARGTRALGTGTAAVSLEALRVSVPGLDAVLASR
jgi:hypothetical protein